MYSKEFNNVYDALIHYTKEYESLGQRYNKTGNELWEEAESSPKYTEDYRKVMSLRMRIDMCVHLIQKDKHV